MKIPSFLDNKQNVLVYRDTVITNQSSYEVTNALKLNDSEPVFLYIQDYQKPIQIDFLEGATNIVYIIFRSSKDSTYKVDINVSENASVSVFTALRNKDRFKVEIERNTSISENAKIKFSNALVNMGETSLLETYDLNEVKAELVIDQLNIASQNDKTIVSQNVKHHQKHTTSNIVNSLISNKNANLDYYVSGKIEKGNEYSICNQLNKGIILSEAGQIKVLPMLFIDEYNVEASHGAAIGQMDEEQLYYLLSRGLTELEAKTLIIYGYTNPFISSIEDEDIQQFIERQIDKKINEGDIL